MLFSLLFLLILPSALLLATLVFVALFVSSKKRRSTLSDTKQPAPIASPDSKD